MGRVRPFPIKKHLKKSIAQELHYKNILKDTLERGNEDMKAKGLLE